jgi:hypothetical protein
MNLYNIGGVYNSPNENRYEREITTDKDKDNNRREKRAWISAIGSSAKTVIGLATEDDITNIEKHISQFETKRNSIVQDETKISYTMHSLLATADQRQGILKSMIDNLKNSMKTRDFRATLEHKLTVLIGIGSLQYTNLLAFRAQLLRHVGVNRLLEGYVPSEFISPTMLRKVVETNSNYTNNYQLPKMYLGMDVTLNQTIRELNSIRQTLFQQTANWFHSWDGSVHLRGLKTNDKNVKLLMDDTMRLFEKDVNYLLNKWSPIDSYAVKRQHDRGHILELEGNQHQVVQNVKDVCLDNLLNNVSSSIRRLDIVLSRLREKRTHNGGYETPIPCKRQRRNKVITKFFRITEEEGTTVWKTSNSETTETMPECQTTNETVGITNENQHDSQYTHPTEVQMTNHIENIYENDNWEEGEICEGQQTVTDTMSKPTTMAAVTTAVTAATTTVTAVTAKISRFV